MLIDAERWMRQVVNGFWRTVYRLGYPFARVVWSVTRRPGHGAAIAVWHEGRLLCVRESYRPGLGLPGGGVNAGETAAEAARRELFEEVGLALDPELFRRTGELAYLYDGRPIEDRVFEVELEAAAQLRIDEREIVWAGFLEPEALARERLQHGLRLYLEQIPR